MIFSLTSFAVVTDDDMEDCTGFWQSTNLPEDAFPRCITNCEDSENVVRDVCHCGGDMEEVNIPNPDGDITRELLCLDKCDDGTTREVDSVECIDSAPSAPVEPVTLGTCAGDEPVLDTGGDATCECPDGTFHDPDSNTCESTVADTQQDDVGAATAAANQEACENGYARKWKPAEGEEPAVCTWGENPGMTQAQELANAYAVHMKNKFKFYQLILAKSEEDVDYYPSSNTNVDLTDEDAANPDILTSTNKLAKCRSDETEECFSTRIYGFDTARSTATEAFDIAIAKAEGAHGELQGGIDARDPLKKCVQKYGGWDEWHRIQDHGPDQWFTEKVLERRDGKGYAWAKAMQSIVPGLDKAREKWSEYQSSETTLVTLIDGACGVDENKKQECEVWRDYLGKNSVVKAKDIIRMKSQLIAKSLIKEIRICDSLMYSTRYNQTEFTEEEEMVSSLSPALKCENKGIETQDYGTCIKVLKAYDTFAIVDMGVQQAASIHSQMSATKNQADLMIDAAEDPMDPTLALKELKGNTSTLGREAVGIAAIEAAKGAYLLKVASDFPSWTTFLGNCRNDLEKLSDFDKELFYDIMGKGSHHDASYQASNSAHFFMKKTKISYSDWAKRFLSTSKDLASAIVIPGIRMNSYLLNVSIAAEGGDAQSSAKQTFIDEQQKADEKLGGQYDSIGASATLLSEMGSDPSNHQGRVPDVGYTEAGIDQPILNQYAEYILNLDHCDVALERIGGKKQVLPNEKIKNIAKQLGAQAIAKAAVKAAAATAYFVQAHQIQNMIDDIDTRMEDLDMGGLYSDILNIGQCELNPTMPECGGYNMGSYGHGFDSGFGSLDMDGGAATTTGSAGQARDVAGSVDTTTGVDGDPSGDFSGAIDGAPGSGSGIVDGSSSAASVKRKGLGGAGGGGASAPSAGLPGGGGGASAPGGGKGGGRYKKKGGYGYNSGKGLYYKSARRGKKGKKNMAELFKGKKSGKTTNFRNVAGVGDSKTSIWKRLSNGYGKAYKSKRLLEYEIID
jgi:hypothetical protein